MKLSHPLFIYLFTGKEINNNRAWLKIIFISVLYTCGGDKDVTIIQSTFINDNIQQ